MGFFPCPKILSVVPVCCTVGQLLLADAVLDGCRVCERKGLGLGQQRTCQEMETAQRAGRNWARPGGISRIDFQGVTSSTRQSKTEQHFVGNLQIGFALV